MTNAAIKRIWNITTWVVVIVTVILAVLIAGIRLFGVTPYTVLSGSMEPTYHTGSLIYVKPVDHTRLETGDVITFMLSDSVVATHRIVEIVPDEADPEILRFRTKGDANNMVDNGLVHSRNIIGTPVFTLPLLGYIAHFVQNPPGLYIALGVLVVMAVLILLQDCLPELKKEKESERRQK